jgi:aromatic ring hydroxylase
MGNNCVVSADAKNESKHDKDIAKYLKDEKRKLEEEIKLLLLGKFVS